MDEVWLLLLSQLPLVLYTIANGILRFRADIKKTQAETVGLYSGAVRDAGETLEAAWEEIRKLHDEIEEERSARKRLEREIRRWTYFAGQLIEQVRGAGLVPVPFPPESYPRK